MTKDRFFTGRMRKDNKDAGSLEKRVSRQRCGEGVGDSVVEPKLFFSAPAPVFIKFWLQLWLQSRFWLQLEPESITFLLKMYFCMKCQFYYYLGGQRQHLCRISFFFYYATEGQQCFNILLQYGMIQCCRAETICFRSHSNSDFQKVSAPAPTSAL
jgi:hypothetical protein